MNHIITLSWLVNEALLAGIVTSGPAEYQVVLNVNCLWLRTESVSALIREQRHRRVANKAAVMATLSRVKTLTGPWTCPLTEWALNNDHITDSWAFAYTTDDGESIIISVFTPTEVQYLLPFNYPPMFGDGYQQYSETPVWQPYSDSDAHII